ncbi:MAG: hypothetical protein B6I24_09080 [Bacteroidetes bacterium 4572_128]|nr:MAG: hypothetical protein B6I24_09080 [Bacteroidetes bacterium 4572_128]
MISKEKNYYIFLKKRYLFPQGEFEVKNNFLFFNGIDLNEIIKKYSTPLRISFLPKITENIEKSFFLFKKVMSEINYEGEYFYAYCTKTSPFSFILDKMLKERFKNFGIEISSSFDIEIIRNLYKKNIFTKKNFLICNGFKTENYISGILELYRKGLKNIITIIDNQDEIYKYNLKSDEKLNIGIRLMTRENFHPNLKNSRFGISEKNFFSFYQKNIKNNSKFRLKLLHLFAGSFLFQNENNFCIEIEKIINLYCVLKKDGSTDLDSINIGGGFPAKFSLDFNFDFEETIFKIINIIYLICEKENVKVPNIFTEFGTYTVAESGAIIASVIGEKNENNKEKWYILNTSFFSTIPNVCSFNKKYICLPINNWNKSYEEVNIGGLTCDNSDFYNKERNIEELVLPLKEEKKDLYLGFFNTGAYEEVLGSYSGLQHCLIPSPKHIIIDIKKDGSFDYFLFKKEQKEKEILKILGF